MRNSRGSGQGANPPDPPLLDQDLLDEIDLLTELIAAAATTPGRLPQQRVDNVLEGQLAPRIIYLRAIHSDAEF